jgi:hypothetical protein
MNIKSVTQVIAVPVAAIAGFGITWAVMGKDSSTYSTKPIQKCLTDQGYNPTVAPAAFNTTEIKFQDKGTPSFVVVAKDDKKANKVGGVIAAAAYYTTGGVTSLQSLMDQVVVKNNVVVFPKNSPGANFVLKTCL